MGPLLWGKAHCKLTTVGVARHVAANSRRWQRNSRYLLNSVLTIAYFDGLGMPLSRARFHVGGAVGSTSAFGVRLGCRKRAGQRLDVR